MVVWWMKLIFLISVSLARRPRIINHGVKLRTCRPLIIAHRGASGILPEHTGNYNSIALANETRRLIE